MIMGKSRVLSSGEREEETGVEGARPPRLNTKQRVVNIRARGRQRNLLHFNIGVVFAYLEL